MVREKNILLKRRCKMCGSKFTLERKFQKELKNQICKNCRSELFKRKNENKKDA